MNTEMSARAAKAPPADARRLPGQRWEAVVRRDKRADGEFVYAVRTTGVYCRPSCPSRTAKRENVEFFDTNELAAAAGYRACKRCKPEALSQEQRRKSLVIRACRAIEQSASALLLEQLARQAGLSPHHFHRIFKDVTGLTPKDFYQSVRARRVAASLQSAQSVTEAIYEAGFNSAGGFYEGAGAMLGMSPGAQRAVAHACASNQVAVAIPCHRVVRSDGELAGYRWGVERKAELLRRESGREKGKGLPVISSSADPAGT